MQQVIKDARLLTIGGAGPAGTVLGETEDYMVELMPTLDRRVTLAFGSVMICHRSSLLQLGVLSARITVDAGPLAATIILLL